MAEVVLVGGPVNGQRRILGRGYDVLVVMRSAGTLGKVYYKYEKVKGSDIMTFRNAISEFKYEQLRASGRCK